MAWSSGSPSGSDSEEVDSTDSADWPELANAGTRRHEFLRFWVYAFLTAKNYGHAGRPNCWGRSFFWVLATIYQSMMAAAVVGLFLLDSTTDVTVTTAMYWKCEAFFTAIWGVDYILRVWSCVEEVDPVPKMLRKRCMYRVWKMVQPLMLVDLLSLVSLLVDLNIDSNDLRGIGALRMLRIFTLCSLERNWRFCGPVVTVMFAEAHLLGAAVGLSLTALLFASVLMFYAEAPYNEGFASMSDCLWWGSTALTTVGYGDLYPKTGLGRVIASVTAFVGIGIFALPAGIISNGFQQRAAKKHQENQMDDDMPATYGMLENIVARLEARIDDRMREVTLKMDSLQGDVDALRTEIRSAF